MKTFARLSKMVPALLSLMLWFGAATHSMAETVKGKEVKPYLGQVVKLIEKRGRIQIKTDKKGTRRWQVGKFTSVYQGKKRRVLMDATAGRRVRVYVADKGKVLRIDLLEAPAK